MYCSSVFHAMLFRLLLMYEQCDEYNDNDDDDDDCYSINSNKAVNILNTNFTCDTDDVW